MVGVPGRSKGCAECRKRKKGCDLKKPSCTRCQKARVQCSGYDRDRAFIFVTPNVAAPTKALIRPRLETITVQTSLTQSAFRDKYLSLFWDLYLHKGGHSPSKEPRVRQHVGAWVSAARDLHQADPALHKALLSLSLSIIGQKEKKGWMVEEALKLHCNSLNDLTKGLESPERAKSEPLLLAARALGMYELLHGNAEAAGAAVTRGRSWRGHNQGLMSMLLQRTPEMHVDGRAHELFVDARIVLTIDAVLSRKRTQFSDIRWKAIPWTKHKKTPKDFLYDIFNDIAGVLEDADTAAWCQDPTQKAQLQRMVIQGCWNVESDLTWWFNTYAPQQHVANILSWGFASPTPTDFPIAHMMCGYWAANVLTYATLRLAVAPATLADLPDRTDPRIYCKNILDMIEIFFHPSAGEFWLHSLVFPLGIAYVFLLATEPDWAGAPSPEAQKMDGYLCRRGELSRLRMRQFIKGILLAATPHVAVHGTHEDPDAGDDGLEDQCRAWFGMQPKITTPSGDEEGMTFSEISSILESMGFSADDEMLAPNSAPTTAFSFPSMIA